MFDNSPECRRRSMLNKYIGCVTKLLSCPYQTGHFRNGLTPEQCFHTEHHLIVTFSLLVRVQRDREKKLVNICGEKNVVDLAFKACTKLPGETLSLHADQLPDTHTLSTLSSFQKGINWLIE